MGQEDTDTTVYRYILSYVIVLTNLSSMALEGKEITSNQKKIAIALS